MAARHRGRERFQTALGEKLERAGRYHGDGGNGFATVTGLDPLTAELVAGRHVLEEDKLNPTVAVTGYDALKVGDTLVLVAIGGDYSAVGVIPLSPEDADG